MIIHKITDKIKVKIGEIAFWVSPLSWDQKQDILSDAKMNDGKVSNRNSTYKCIKYAVKDIEGVVLSDGSPYTLKLENGVLSDESVEEILNLELSPRLIMTCYSLVHGVPNKIFNPVTGEPLEGVEIVSSGSKKKT
jgi:hypothetical protein